MKKKWLGNLLKKIEGNDIPAANLQRLQDTLITSVNSPFPYILLHNDNNKTVNDGIKQLYPF